MSKLAALSLLFLSSVAVGCPPPETLTSILHNEIGAARAEASTSYALTLVHGDELLCEQYMAPDRNIYPASAIKTLIAFATLRAVDQNRITLNQDVKITQSNAAQECSSGFSSCKYYGPGKIVQVSKLLEDMITASNNLATNQLTDLLSKAYINSVADELGLPSLRIIRKVYDQVNPEPENPDRNRATARGLAALYREIATGRLQILSPASRTLLVETLGRQRINGSLNKLFPPDEKFFHKTGNTSQVTADGGFYFLGDGRIVILVGLQDFNRFRDCESCPVRTGFQTLQKVGRAVFDLVD